MKELRACMLAFYSEANDRSKDDIILVKERVQDANGVETSNLQIIPDFNREFYITKPGKRKEHKEKKEYELLENLTMYTSTQARLADSIAKVLGIRSQYNRLSEIKNSPYVYGVDISTTSLVKQQYLDRWPTYQPKAIVATLDLETNVFTERGEIIYGCVTCKDKAILAVNKEWLGDVFEPEERLQELFEKYLSKYKKERNITLYVRVVKDDLAIVKMLFGSLHKIKPDFVSIWNMVFDIEKILECLEHHNVPPEDIFCAPEVPRRFRRFWWKKDNPIKTTATGKKTSKHNADLWHVVDAPASFYIIDSMCFFKINRVREQNRPSYSLDSILNDELDLEKLKFKEAEGYEGLELHQLMQSKYKLEYGIYNVFDCIALELLDEKTGDLSKAVLGGLGITDLKNLTSGPKNLANDLHIFLKEQGKIICCSSQNMSEEYDQLTMGMKAWIKIMPSDLVAVEGQPFIKDMGSMPSKLYTHIFDVDIASGYPTTGLIMNTSKETTIKEVCEIEGLTEKDLRRCGVNLTAIRNNAIDLGQTLYSLPNMENMLKEYKNSLV